MMVIKTEIQPARTFACMVLRGPDNNRDTRPRFSGEIIKLEKGTDSLYVATLLNNDDYTETQFWYRAQHADHLTIGQQFVEFPLTKATHAGLENSPLYVFEDFEYFVTQHQNHPTSPSA